MLIRISCIFILCCFKFVWGQTDTVAYKALSLKNGIQFFNDSMFSGVVKQTSKEGKTLFIVSYKDGKLHGNYFYYYENGKVQTSKNFINGEVDGAWEDWHRNGVKASERNYKVGEPHGVTSFWNAEGDLTLQSNYKNGLKEGKNTSWYEKSKFYAQCDYVQGEKNGIEKSWYKNGQLKHTIEWKNGVRKGTSKKWSEEGELVYQDFYQVGKRIKRIDYTSGKPVEMFPIEELNDSKHVKVISALRINKFEGPKHYVYYYIEIELLESDIEFDYFINGIEDVEIGEKQEGYNGREFYAINGSSNGKSIVLISNYAVFPKETDAQMICNYSNVIRKQTHLLNNLAELHYTIEGKKYEVVFDFEEINHTQFKR